MDVRFLGLYSVQNLVRRLAQCLLRRLDHCFVGSGLCPDARSGWSGGGFGCGGICDRRLQFGLGVLRAKRSGNGDRYGQG